METKRVVFLIMGLLLLLTGCGTMTPLTKASSRGDIGVMKDLIQKGVNLNEPGESSDKATALHWAASDGHVEAVRTLLASGANINSIDYCRQTPIFYAIKSTAKNNIFITKLLIDHGADLTVIDCDKMMPIDYASRNQDLAIVELLTAKSRESTKRLKETMYADGSRLDLPLNIGNCRMELETNKAVISGNMQHLKGLISAGADLDEADCYGYRPMDYAKRYQLDEISGLIKANVRKSAKGDRDFPKGRWDDSINFANAVPTISYAAANKIGIAVNDQRPYVLTKEKKPDYVGYTRYNAGPPKDMATRDRKPFAGTLQSLMVRGYGNAHAGDESTTQNKPARMMAVQINEWLVQTQFWVGNVEVKYNLDLRITNNQGKELFSKNFAGKEVIAAHNSAPYERAIIISPEVLYFLLTDILNQPELKAALL